MYTSVTDIKVRYVETDKMGIVHHSNYYIWFEVARGDFIGRINMNYSDLEKKGIMMPIVETHCKYLKPAKYDDNLVIKTSIGKLTPVKIVFDYEVVNKDTGKILALGKTLQAFVNRNFKIINIEREYSNLFENIKKLL